MSYSENKFIDEYLAQLKKSLPDWLKWKEDEIKSVLEDIKTQIMNEAQIIAGGESITDQHIQQAISQIGTPESIAKEYKQRGTPKFYLTEELFEFYLRVLFFFFAIVLIINILVAVFSIFTRDWWDILGGFFSGIWIGLIITLVVITAVFVYFSMEGYLPEDFGVIPKRLEILFPMRSLSKEKREEISEYTKEKLAEAKIRAKEKITEAREKAKASIEKAKIHMDEKLEVAKIRREEQLEEAKRKRELRKYQPVSMGELIFGAAAGIIFGLFIIIQPFVPVAGFMHPDFLNWLRIFGLLIFVGGLFNLIRLVVGVRNFTGQQVFLVIETFYNISYIPIFLLLLQMPEKFPIDIFSGGLITVIPNNPDHIAFIIYFWVVIFIVIATIGGMIGNMYKVYRLQTIKY